MNGNERGTVAVMVYVRERREGEFQKIVIPPLLAEEPHKHRAETTKYNR